MTPFIQQYIEKYIDLIENNDFEKLYGYIPVRFANYTGELTQVLLESGIDPLEHMNYAPPHYLTGSSLETLKLPEREDFYLLYNNCFAFSGLKHIYLPQNIELVSDGAFNHSKLLEKVDMSDSQISNVNKFTFDECSSLVELKLPHTLWSIEDNAFEDCYKLKELVYNGTISDWNDFVHLSRLWKRNSNIKLIRCIDGIIELHD